MAIVNIAALRVPHSREAFSVSWRLTSAGVSVDGLPPGRTWGKPATVARVWRWFGPLIIASAIKHYVPVELIVATMCVESGRSGQTNSLQMSDAYREEPGYVSDDVTPDKVSAGCMQTLLSTAREITGNLALTVDELMDPAISIDAGTHYIASQAVRARGQATSWDPPLVAAAYNSGGLYVDTSTANRWRLRCYPIGTGEYIDRSLLWFNDAMSLGVAPCGPAPSFARAVLWTPHG